MSFPKTLLNILNNITRSGSFIQTSTRCLHLSSCMTATKDNKGVAVKKEAPRKRPPRFAMDWKVVEQTYRYSKEFWKDIFTSLRKKESKQRHFKRDHVVYYFRDKIDLKHWYLMTDEDVGGSSWAELRQGDNEMTARFRGYLSEKRPPDMKLTDDPLAEKTVYHGFVYMETKPFITVLDKHEMISLLGFNTVKIKLRGDGRKYSFEMVCNLGMDVRISYTAPVYTSGGPLWEEISIPYSKFIPSRKSSFMEIAQPMDVNKIENFRFMLSDGIEGPFQLEIDFIALAKDLSRPYGGTDYNSPWFRVNAHSGR